MANHASAEKRFRQSQKRRVRNNARRSQVRTAVRKLHDAIASKDQKISEVLQSTTSTLMRASKTGILHKRTASRKVARLSRQVHKIKKS